MNHHVVQELPIEAVAEMTRMLTEQVTGGRGVCGVLEGKDESVFLLYTIKE